MVRSARRRSASLILALFAVASAIWAPGCAKKTTQAGGLELTLSTDLSTPGDYDSIFLQVEQQTGTADGGSFNTLFKDTFVVPKEATLPTSFSIAAGTNADQVVFIEFAALKDGLAVDLREAEVQVPRDRIAALTLTLSESCLDQVTTVDGQYEPTCPSGQSCQPQSGTCGTNAVAPGMISNYQPNPTCDGGLAVCGNDCVDTTTDQNNCGSCGHDCLGGACEDSACGPITLATDNGNPFGIIVYSNQIYWTDGRYIRGMLTSGQGGLQVLEDGRSTIQALAADQDEIYWSEAYRYSGGGLFSCPLDGSCSPDVPPLASLGQTNGVAVDVTAGLLYFDGVDFGDVGTYVRRCPSGGAPCPAPETIDVTASPGDGLALAGNNLVWWSGGTSSGIWSCSTPAQSTQGCGTMIAAQPAVDGGVQTTALSLNQDYVYWSVQNANLTYGESVTSATVFRALLDGDGGAAEVVVSGGVPTAVAVTADKVYYPDFANGWIVQCNDLACGTTQILVKQLQQPFAIAQDALAIYWVNYGDGRVMKLAK